MFESIKIFTINNTSLKKALILRFKSNEEIIDF